MAATLKKNFPLKWKLLYFLGLLFLDFLTVVYLEQTKETAHDVRKNNRLRYRQSIFFELKEITKVASWFYHYFCGLVMIILPVFEDHQP